MMGEGYMQQRLKVELIIILSVVLLGWSEEPSHVFSLVADKEDYVMSIICHKEGI